MDPKNGNNSNDDNSKRYIDEEEEEEEAKIEPKIKKKKSSRDCREEKKIRTRSALLKKKNFFENLSVCEDTKKFLTDIITKREFENINADSDDEDKAEHRLRDTFLQFVSQGVSSQSLSIEEKKRLITPEIITQIGEIPFDRLFDVIENDYAFILLALMLKINVEFFRPDNNLQYKDKEYYHYDDFPKIKRRWMVLEQMQRSPIFCDKRSRNQEIVYGIVQVICNSIKKNLLDRILNYCYYAKKNKSSKLETNVTPYDASFATHYINDENFNEVTKAVEDKQITFFSTSPCLEEDEDFYPYYHLYHPLASYPLDYIEQVSRHDDDKKNLRSKLGVNWKHGIRNACLRNFVLTIVAEDALIYFFSIHMKTDTIDKKGKIDEDDKDAAIIENCARRLEYLYCWLHETNFNAVLCHWDIPLTILLRVFNIVLHFIKHNCVKDFAVNWTGDTFGCLFLQIIKRYNYRRIDSIPKTNFDDAVEIILTQGESISNIIHHIFKYCKDTFTPKRVKYFAYMILMAEMNVADKDIILSYMFYHFRWLLNTWIDHAGRTLLCLCLLHSRRVSFEMLLKLEIVRKHIDVECKNGQTVLFVEAAKSRTRRFDRGFSFFFDIIYIGRANLAYINSHNESVLHHLAMRNKYQELKEIHRNDDLWKKVRPLLELRRTGDGATALMIALVKENLDAACVLLEMGAVATSLFGKSETLRTIEALLLKRKWLSLTLLARKKNLRPKIKNITTRGGKSLFLEECMNGATGLDFYNNKNGLCINLAGGVTRAMKHVVRRKNRRYVEMVDRKKMTIYSDVYPTNKDRDVLEFVGFEDLTWSLFADEGDCLRLRWPSVILSSDDDNSPFTEEDSSDGICGDGGMLSRLDFGNSKCAICWRGFGCRDDIKKKQKGENDDDDDDDDDGCIGVQNLSRGVTECGHAFHQSCWETLGSNICPVCRDSSTLNLFIDEDGGKEENNDNNDDDHTTTSQPPVNHKTEGKIYRKKRCLLSMREDNDGNKDVCNEKGNRRDDEENRNIAKEEEEEIYPYIARYEYFIDGNWVDESSKSNILYT